MRGLGLVAVVLLTASACTGSIGGSSGGPGSSGPGNPLANGPRGAGAGPTGAGPTGAGGPLGTTNPGQPKPPDPGAVVIAPPSGYVPPVAAACATVGRQPMRRLNRIEYNNTVADLLGDTTKAANQFPPDAEQFGFDNIAQALTVTSTHVEQFMKAAETLATTATAPTNIAKLLPCDPKAVGEEACARTFVGSFGQRAFRRALPTEDVDRYVALYKSVRQTSDFASGIKAVVYTMLQSPQFLYRIEEAPASGTGPVTPYELASRLSYFFWSSAPDDELYQAAASGSLARIEEVEKQARRLLGSSRSRAVVEHFHEKWLKLGEITQSTKSKKTFADFNSTPLVAANMVQETQTFLNDLIYNGDARFENLFKAKHSFVNNRLGKIIYGLAQPPPGEPLVRVDLDPAQRSGILTNPGILTAQSGDDEGAAATPIARGVFVREQLLCQELPPAPADVPPPPAPKPGASTRDTLTLHRQPACAGCHRLIDMVGFGLDRYDPVGKYRTTVGTKTVDSSGELVGTADIDGTFDGAIQLADRLVRSKEARACIAKNWFRFSLGRHEVDADTCALDWVQEAFAQSGGNIRELLVNLARSHAFRFKSASVQ